MWMFKTKKTKQEIEKEFLEAGMIYLQCEREKKCLEEFLVICDLQNFKHISKHKILNPFAIYWLMQKMPNLNFCFSSVIVAIGFMSWIKVFAEFSSIIIAVQMSILAVNAYVLLKYMKIGDLLCKIRLDELKKDLSF